MMDWTDRHCRFFHRKLSRHALLYTEMVTAPAIIHGVRERLLGFSPEEQPVAIQLGGSDPAQLAEAARIGADWGYAEINLNVGCPSDRVQEGRFGACLMLEPELVARLYVAMASAVSIPVTVKCRIGVDYQDEEKDFTHFIETVSAAGCRTFIVHARKAWLSGLSPKENREVPPLHYERVRRLKLARPDLEIVLNGGIATLDDACRHLQWADGVMLGRAAYQTPHVLAGVDQAIFNEPGPPITREQAIELMLPYVEQHISRGGRLNNITRHMLGLYHGQPRGRAYRRWLSENAVRPGVGADVLSVALDIVNGHGPGARTAAE